MKTRSNTIRSIVPARAQIDGEEMLLFNLSALSVNEDISSAELHFYKRRHSGDRGRSDKKQHPHHPQQQRRRHWWQLQHLQGYSVAEQRQQIGKWEVEADRRGWMVYDVTKAVDQWEHNHNSNHQIGFLFQGIQRSSGLYNSLPLDSVVRMDPSPFLIIFSNERSNASLEQAAGLKKTPSLNALPDSGATARTRRSVTDNELPEMDHFDQNNVIPQSNPSGILKVRNSNRKSHHHTQKITQDPPLPANASKRLTETPASYTDMDPKDAKYSEWPTKSSTLPYPKNRSRIPEDKRKRSRKGKRRNRKLPETWHYNQQHANDARLELPEDAGKSLCQRRKLSVDFNEIGWGEWIISPKTFDAQYCTGRCPFPLTKGLNPTNHATIQSIVHAIGGYPEVPAPCCVPDVLSSLTLLYFDDNRNVVLKNYPSMTAESCACR